MKLISFLGQNLKDDAVIELLDHYGMEVLYEFDRLHENTADAYSSTANSAGFELRFNEHQILDTIWCHVMAHDGFVAVDTSILGTPCYKSFKEALRAAEASSVRVSKPPTGSESWIRLEEARIWRHYEFSDGELSLVTFMLPWER